MTNRRWIVWTVIGGLFIVLAIAGYLALFSDEKVEKKKISVLLNESMDDRWVIVKEGMEQAATDYDAELNIVLTDRIANSNEQQNLILREIEGGTNGIVLEPVAGVGLSNFIGEHQGNVAITLIGSDLTPQNVYDCVAPDSFEMGKVLGKTFVEDYENSQTKPVIGVFASASPNYAAEQCMKGFMEEIEYSNGVLRFDPDSKMSDEILDEINHEGIDVLVAFESRMTEKLVDFVANAGFESLPRVYGTGYSQKAIYYLDKGIVSKLVLTNEFNLGYLAVESSATKQSPRGLKYPEMEIYVVDRNNLYDEAFQKILFPLVQ